MYLLIALLSALFFTTGQAKLSHPVSRHLPAADKFLLFNKRAQDSLPPLHTLPAADIADVKSSWNESTVTVSLKDGTVYVYDHAHWDDEDNYTETDERIRTAIGQIQKTFIKTEVPPQFPGGKEAFDAYVRSYCKAHKSEIQGNGTDEFTLHFIVHLKGQIRDVEVENSVNGSGLSPVAIRCLTEGPAWIPAFQNGRNVICYAKVKMKIRI